MKFLVIISLSTFVPYPLRLPVWPYINKLDFDKIKKKLYAQRIPFTKVKNQSIMGGNVFKSFSGKRICTEDIYGNVTTC